jgi:hypothetical protein
VTGHEIKKRREEKIEVKEEIGTRTRRGMRSRAQALSSDTITTILEKVNTQEQTRTKAIARSLEKKKGGKILLIQFNRIQVYNV